MNPEDDKDHIPTSQGERMGLSFMVDGTNIEAYRLVNGLQGAHKRVEDLLYNWNQLDRDARENTTDQIVWLLGTAAKLIRQMSDRPDAPQHALMDTSVTWDPDLKHMIGWDDKRRSVVLASETAMFEPTLYMYVYETEDENVLGSPTEDEVRQALLWYLGGAPWPTREK